MSGRPVRSFLVVLALAVAPLLLGEMLARSLTWTPADLTVAEVQLGFSDSTPGDWSPNQEGVSVSRPETPFYIRINEAGFRNVEPLDEKAAQVLVLGDSQAFGQYVSAYDTWTSVAQRAWNQEHPRQRVQLLNNGMPGGTVVDYVGYLRDKGPLLSPRLVLIAISSTDVEDMRRHATPDSGVRSQRKRRTGTVWMQPLRRFLGQHSGLYNLVRNLRAGLPVAEPAPPVAQAHAAAGAPRVEPDEAEAFRSFTVETISAARALGSAVAVVYIGGGETDADPRPGVISMSVADELGVAKLDLGEEFWRHDPRDLFLVDPVSSDEGYPADGHLARYGHRVTGLAVARFLESVLAVEEPGQS